MNVYDSERMTDILGREGYSTTDTPDDADLILLNTCHIREKAAEKVYSDLGRLKRIKDRRDRNGQSTLIGVAGCVAQAEAGEIISRQPSVDLVFGPQTYHELPDLVARARSGKVLSTEFPVDDKFDHITTLRRRGGLTAFVTVQEGCDKFCTFCVVPYTRGAEFSRPVDQITSEVHDLVSQGTREITLLGQNVNAYRGKPPKPSLTDVWGLGRLISHLSEIEGLARIRYTTSHPRDMTEDLVAAHRDCPKLMPYLHLPLQSGSDRILEAMNRQYTCDDYLRIIDRVRAARPDIALSSDFIVGFPGETDADFQATLKMIERVGYAQAFSFKYSPRPGTPGADLDRQVEDDRKSERLQELQALLAAQQTGFNQTCVGRPMEVLLEKPGRHPGQVTGRSPYLQAVHVDVGKAGAAAGIGDWIGRFATVEVTAARPNSLAGRIVSASPPRNPRPRESDAFSVSVR